LICEGNTEEISCSDGKTLSIVYASYGREVGIVPK